MKYNHAEVLKQESDSHMHTCSCNADVPYQRGDQTLSMATRRLGFQIRNLQTLKAAAGVLLPNMDFRHTDQSSDTHKYHRFDFTAFLLQLYYRIHSSCTRQNFYSLTTSPLPLVHTADGRLGLVEPQQPCTLCVLWGCSDLINTALSHG